MAETQEQKIARLEQELAEANSKIDRVHALAYDFILGSSGEEWILRALSGEYPGDNDD